MKAVYLCLGVAAALCLANSGSSAAFERQIESVRGSAMGGAGLALGGNVWGGLMNPAALAGIPGRVIALSMRPSPFGLPELRRIACAYAEPVGAFTASVSAVRFGCDMYREITFGASCGIDCGFGLRAGGTVTLNSLSISGYGSGRCAGFDAGILWEIAPGIDVGACASNVNAPSPGRSGEAVPRTFQAGIAYRAAGGLLVACDVAEDPRFPAEIRLGAEILLAGTLALRGGVSTDPSIFSAGAGIRISLLEVDYAYSVHQELGSTHHLGISVRLGGA